MCCLAKKRLGPFRRQGDETKDLQQFPALETNKRFKELEPSANIPHRIWKKQQRRKAWKRGKQLGKQQKSFLDVIMQDMTLEDAYYMNHFHDLEQRIEVFSPETSSMLHVRDCKVPWPIVWVLARFSRKHIFSSRKLPPPEWMRSAMQDFGQRIRWKWVFRNSSAPKPSIVFRSTSHCGHVVDPGFVFWLDRFHRQMIGEMLRACKRAKQRRAKCPTCPH